MALGQIARDPGLLEAALLVHVVDEQAQFGCLLAADGVLSAPLHALSLQHLVERLVPEPGRPLHLWCNNAALLREASEMIGHVRRIAGSTAEAPDARDLQFVDLAAPGASWNLQASRQDPPGERERPGIVLIAPEDERAGQASFGAEMRALVEQSGLPRRELLRVIATAIGARMRGA